MRDRLPFAGKKPANRERRGYSLGKLCRCCLALVVILCHLLAGCENPTKVTDQPAGAPLTGQISFASDEQNMPLAEKESAAMASSFVDSRVSQEEPPAVLMPPIAIGERTEVHSVSRGPTITFDKTVHDYGQVSPRSKNVCEFRFKNTGTGTLTVGRKIDSTCGCTATTLAKTDYVPSEEGVIKVTYSASTLTTTVKKYMTVHSNDKENPQVRLTITAKIVPRVAYEPKQLDLLLNGNAEACPPITLRSLDGTAFSVTGVLSTGNCITAEFDPSVKATEFTIRPTPDMEKLQRLPAGYLVLTLTHPECKHLRIKYQTRSGFQFVPALLLLFNTEPNIPVQRDVWLSNNYGEDFEIASFSSERNLVDVIEKKKVAPKDEEGARYRLRLSIMPPIRVGEKGIFTDTLSVHLTNGQTPKLNCRGFYATTQAATPYPPP